MNRGLVRKTVRDWRGGAVGVALISAAIGFFDVLVFPEYQETLKEFEDLAWVRGFVGEAGSIATPEGFLATEFFSWIPLLLITLAIIAATGTLVGDEADGTLDLILAQPISRRRLMASKMAGIVLHLVVATLAMYPAIIAATFFVDFDLSAWRILQGLLNMLPVTFLFLALAAWASTSLPSRATAAILTIGALVALYFLNMIGASVEALGTARKISPFYWADTGRVLVRGFDFARAGGLLAIGAGLMALAVHNFERRDIAAGVREWSWRGLLGRG